MVTRRELLLATAALPAFAAKPKPVNITRISAISDELARSQAASIDFAKQYGMSHLDLRGVPGAKASYWSMPEAELRAAAKEFAANGIKIDHLAASLLKFSMPGTDPIRKTPDSPEARKKRIERDGALFERRMEDLRKCIQSAHILGAKYIRAFAFSRVEDPAALLPRVADIIGPMAELAGKEGVQLALENEGSCNVATCSESAALAKLIPGKGFGLIWDTMNGGVRETAFPDGYQLLPKERITNVHMKGRALLDEPTKQDWTAIFRQLSKDGYTGNFCLETHIDIGGPGQVPASHKSLEAIQKFLAAV
jgi:hypothetical protein